MQRNTTTRPAMSTVLISSSKKQQAQQLARLLHDAQREQAAQLPTGLRQAGPFDSDTIELPTGYFWLLALSLVALGGYLFSFLTPCRL